LNEVMKGGWEKLCADERIEKSFERIGRILNLMLRLDSYVRLAGERSPKPIELLLSAAEYAFNHLVLIPLLNKEMAKAGLV